MTNKTKQLVLVLMAMAMCMPGVAAEKKQKADKNAAGAVDPEMMKKFEAYSTPGEAHRALNPLVGSFKYTSKSWMDPNAKAEETTGTTESKWIMGGRFVESTVYGTAMGKPFEGKSIVGYDNEKKQYTSVWVDSMATGIMTSNGQYDVATKTLTEQGTASCPMEGTKNFRNVTKFKDDGSHSFEMFTNDKAGKEFRMMEINYTPNTAAPTR